MGIQFVFETSTANKRNDPTNIRSHQSIETKN